MAAVKRIDARIKTATGAGAGTDGDVYLGVGGREFYIDSAQDDFEQGADDVYVLGDGANVLNSAQNDPKNPQLDTNDLSKFPVYLRLEPTGDAPEWHLESVTVTVNPGASEIKFNRLIGGPHHLWLGRKMGKFCYLKKV